MKIVIPPHAKKATSVTNANKPHKLHLDAHYQNLLHEIKTHLRKAQLRATISVKHELIQFYWEVGKLIIERQATTQWGEKLFEMLAQDLWRSFPNTKGFSKTNLKNMRLFAKHYPNGEFGQALPDQLTWTHHIVLTQMFKLEEIHIKQWYAEKTLENGWPYRELQVQTKADLYSRQSSKTLKTTNFKDRLPSPTSQLAQELICSHIKYMIKN